MKPDQIVFVPLRTEFVPDPRYAAGSCVCFKQLEPNERIGYGTHGVRELIDAEGRSSFACERCQTEYRQQPVPDSAATPKVTLASPDISQIEKHLLSHDDGIDLLWQFWADNYTPPAS